MRVRLFGGGGARLTLFLKTLFFWSSVRFAPRPWVPSGPCRPGAQPPGPCLARHAGTLRVCRDDPALAHLVTRSPRPAWGGGFSLGVVRSAGLEEGVTMVPVTGVPRGAPPALKVTSRPPPPAAADLRPHGFASSAAPRATRLFRPGLSLRRAPRLPRARLASPSPPSAE